MNVEVSAIDSLLRDVQSLSEQATVLRMEAQSVSQAVVELLSDETLTDEQRDHLRAILEHSNTMVWSMNKVGAP